MQPIYTERRKAYMEAYYSANREKVLAQRRVYRAANREKLAAAKRAVSPTIRASYSRRTRLRRYGLTETAYREMLLQQGNACALCRRPPLGKSLAVDHDHATGKVRGLLCLPCNVGLGQYEKFDSPEVRRYLMRERNGKRQTR